MPDGAIVISTKLDTKQTDKDLAKLKKDIHSTEDTIGELESKKSPLTTQAEQLQREMKAARVEAQQFGQQWAAGVAGADGQQAKATERLHQIEAEYAKVVGQIDKIDKKLLPAYEKLDRMKEEAGGLQQQINKAANNTKKMEKASKKTQKHMGIFATRLRGIVLSAFVFNILSSGFRELTEWMGKVIKSNDKARSAIAKLKGALLTLAQPLVDIVIPAFIFLVNVLTKVVSALARVFAILTGSTIEASKKSAAALKEQTDALDGVSSSADKASGSLAGFDEINKLSSESSGSSLSTIEPDFDFDVGEELTDFQKFLALLGVGALLIAGLARTFGKTGAAIGLVVAGLALLVGGFRDAIENGWNLKNVLTVIGGIMAAGVGIALLTGSWIPLLIAAIASVLLALTVAYGEGEKLLEGAKQLLSGFVDFFAGIFTGDIERAIAGVGKIFDGLILIVDSVLSAIENMFNSFFDWLDEKTDGKFSSIIAHLKGMVTAAVGLIRDALVGSLDFLKGALQGVVTFLAGAFTGDWDKAWQGVLQITKSAVNFGGAIIESFVNFFVRGANAVIAGLNKINLTVPDWVPGVGGRSFGVYIPSISEVRLPRLATGAVIPPNREFLAVLGDQTSGNNIEAPEGLIRKIVREEAGGWDYTALLEAILAAIKAGKIMRVDKRTLGRVAAEGINDLTLSAGESILIL